MLRGKQARFVEEYLVDLNASQAALRAGYSPKTAHVIGHQTLHRPEVAEAIAAAQAKRSMRTGITQDQVLRELAILDFSDVRNYRIDEMGNLTLAEGVPQEAMRAVSSLKRKVSHDKDGGVTYDVEFRLWNKVGSLRLTAQHLGMLTEKHEISGTIEVKHTLTDGLESALEVAYASTNGHAAD